VIKVSISFELTETQMEALKYESNHMEMTPEELMAWMVRQNIPPLLDVIDGNGSKEALSKALAEEDSRP
jgi:hypothetical protein